MQGRRDIRLWISMVVMCAATAAAQQGESICLNEFLASNGTVLADDPALNVRLDAQQLYGVEPLRQPLRVVLDPDLAMPAQAQMLSLPGQTLVLTTASDPGRHRGLQQSGAEVALVAGAAVVGGQEDQAAAGVHGRAGKIQGVLGRGRQQVDAGACIQVPPQAFIEALRHS